MIAKGRKERYRHPRIRGTWWVKSSTDKYVTLVPELHFLKTRKILADDFPKELGAEWKKV